LPVRLSARSPHQAFALAVGKARRRHHAGLARAPHPARGFERERSDQLQERKMIAEYAVPGEGCERAGAVNLAGHMRGHRETITDSGRLGGGENLEVAPGE